LQQLDRRLENELAEMAQDARQWFLTGTGVEHLRVRSDGDTTHSFDDNLEERLLQAFVQSKLPIRFSSEERADVDLVQSPELLALVDPLDGSEVAARGYPMCSISVSVVDIATATPLLSRIIEVFTSFQYAASEGHATKNGTRIAPSRVRSAKDALVVSYFASKSRMAKVRRSTADWARCRLLINYGGLLDIAKVGSGQCDAMIEVLNGMVAREYVAGVHIAQAAGAVSSTLDGEPIPTLLQRDARSTFIVAATPELHGELLATFAGR